MSNVNSMEKYVYILGAGFSAPLGIPVMKNFLEKAKDQFSAEPEKYKHFSDTFDRINQLHECAYHYDCDIGNIEEILSILLTLDNIKGTNNAGLFKRFIKDVIEYYTPDNCELDIIDNNFRVADVKNAFKLSPYAQFVSAAFNFEYNNKDITKQIKNPANNSTMNHACTIINKITRSHTNANHSFITLNYDLVLETVVKNINKRFDTDYCFCTEEEPDYSVPCLAKIHGCISEADSIIPPTWNKGDLNPSNEKAWKLAGSLLHNAHHIIIIGYSLPETDSYIKYLLKSACISDVDNYTNLKTIKVFDKSPLCKDRYANFIKEFNPDQDFHELDISSLFGHLSLKDGINLLDALKALNFFKKPSTPRLEKTINKLIDERIKKQVKPMRFR